MTSLSCFSLSSPGYSSEEVLGKESDLPRGDKNKAELTDTIFTQLRKGKVSIRIRSSQLKVPGPISQNGVFYSNDASSPKKYWFQISVKSVRTFGYNLNNKKRLCILQLHRPYCVN